MVWLHLNNQNHHLSDQICLQRTSLDDKLKMKFSAKSKESAVTHPKAIKTVHLKAVLTPTIGLTGMVSWIIQRRVKITKRQMMNLIYSYAIPLSLRTTQSTVMGVLHQMFPDRFGQYQGLWDRLTLGWWSLRWTQGGQRETREIWLEWVNMLTPGSISCLTENVT